MVLNKDDLKFNEINARFFITCVMLFFITDYYFPGSLALLVFLVITIVRYIRSKKEQSDAETCEEEVRKLELKKLLELAEEPRLLETCSETEFGK